MRPRRLVVALAPSATTCATAGALERPERGDVALPEVLPAGFPGRIVWTSFDVYLTVACAPEPMCTISAWP
jgi:hypothetical protein